MSRSTCRWRRTRGARTASPATIGSPSAGWCVHAFGPLWLVAPFVLRDVAFARRGLVLVALCVVGMSVAEDAGRDIFIAAPVVYVPPRPSPHIPAGCAGSGHRAVDQFNGVTHGLDATPKSAIPIY